ncbi:MAG: TolC family outer membrane protein [Gammaproteobacteria bacterium]
MDTRKNLISTLFSISLLATSTARAEDLMSVYQQAIISNPELAAAAADRQAIVEKRVQSKAGLLPNIGFNADLSRTRFQAQNPPPPSQRPANFKRTTYSTDKSASLSLTQPLFRYDRWIALKQADSQIAEAEARYAAAEQTLILTTAERYFAILEAGDNQAFATAEKEAIGRQLEQAKQRFEVGLIAITDINEAQARYDLAISQEIQALSNIEGSRDALRETTNQYHEKLDLVKDSLPLESPDPAQPDEWVNESLKQNLNVLAAQAAVETAHHEIKRQRTGHYPTLDLQSSYRIIDQNFGGIAPVDRHDADIGLNLNIPVYQGGAVNSRTREARSRFEQANEQLALTLRRTELQTRNAYRGIQTDIAQVKALRQSLKSTQTAVDAANAGLEVGTRTVVDVLNAQREHFRAKLNYATARYQYLLDHLRLKQAVGSLSTSDLERINQHFKATN